MRRATLILAAMAVAPLAGVAQAQQPAAQQSAAQQPAAQQPGAAAPAGAQAAPGVIPQNQEPARAPGSKADDGKTLPPASDNAGTTTVYSSAPDAKPVRWPCAQRKVPTISAGTIWSGPDIAQGKDWDDDNDVAALAQKIASRRLPLDEVDADVAAFAQKAGTDKSKRLTQLFVGVLEIINANRDQILQGITRYALGQERLAERMREESDKISEQQENAKASDLGVATEQINRDFAWDQRIFKERKQALSYVCETPSLLERRAFEVGKRIQARL